MNQYRNLRDGFKRPEGQFVMRHVVLFLMMALFLCGCGKKEQKAAQPLDEPIPGREPVAREAGDAEAKPGHEDGADAAEIAESLILDFSKDAAAYDLDSAVQCLENPIAGAIAFDVAEDLRELQGFYAEQAPHMEYEIVGTEIGADGEHGRVRVKYTYVDGAPLVKEIAAKVTAKAVLSGADSDEAVMQLIRESFEKEAKQFKGKTTEKEVTFDVVQAQGAWKIAEVPDDFLEVSSCNVRGALAALDLSTAPDAELTCEKRDMQVTWGEKDGAQTISCYFEFANTGNVAVDFTNVRIVYKDKSGAPVAIDTELDIRPGGAVAPGKSAYFYSSELVLADEVAGKIASAGLEFDLAPVQN